MKEAKIYKMKKLILILSLFLGGYANAIEFNAICKSDETKSKDRWFYELKNNKFYLEGKEYPLEETPIINNTSITIKWIDDDWKMESIFNKNNGNMVEKSLKQEFDSPAISYWKCDLF